MINSAFLDSSLQLNGFRSTSVAYCEAQGLALCFSAYAEHSAGEDILEIGFNSNSGYVYIALENGISICSMLGRSVEYLVSDWNTGEEHFFDSYHEAETFEPLEAK
ncbi:MAG: hypothetical protein ACRCW1_08090 [Anaerotignaceae bacterium]